MTTKDLLLSARRAFADWEALPLPASIKTEGDVAFGELWVNSHKRDARLGAAKQRLGVLKAQLWNEKYSAAIEGSEEQRELQRWHEARERYERAMAEYLDAERAECGISQEEIVGRWANRQGAV